MGKFWSGLTAGALAGAAGATAHDAVAYADHAIWGDPTTSSPVGSHVAATAFKRSKSSAGRAAARGALGGQGIGVGVGALAGVIRGQRATPPATLAATLVGLAAMAVGDGLAVISGTARKDWYEPQQLVRDFIPHFVYGVVTSTALHRMLDPHTSTVGR